MIMPCQCCCHMLIIILFVSNAFCHFDKLGVFSNVPIVSLHAFLLVKHVFQTMMENTNIWPVSTWERAMNQHKPSCLDMKSKFIVKVHILEFVAPENFHIAMLVCFKIPSNRNTSKSKGECFKAPC